MMNVFQLEQLNTNFRTEILAGLTTFLATMYILVVNPAILSATGMPFNAVLTATVLVSAFSSIMMGIYANNPIVLAPGMGINAFFTYTVVLGQGIRWETALGAVFWSGIVFLLLSAFNVRSLIVKAIPQQLRYAISGGIGIFITLIGLVNAGFIVDNPSTLISFGGLNPSITIFIIGLFVTCILVVKRIIGALVIGIGLTTVLALSLGRLWGEETLVVWQGVFAHPDFSLFFQLDLLGSLKLAFVPIIFSFVFVDMFDSLLTFVAVAEAADLKDEHGDPLNIRRSLIVDSLSTVVSGLFGTSAGTSYIESATGIEEGGRSGLTAVVAGLLFLPFMFFSSLLSIVPQIATATALVIVGAFMMSPVMKVDWDNLEEAIPAFLAIILIPVTYSINQGIIWAFLSWTVIKLATGKKEQVTFPLIVIDLVAILSLLV